MSHESMCFHVLKGLSVSLCCKTENDENVLLWVFIELTCCIKKTFILMFW